MSDTDKTKAAPKAGGRGARFQVAMDDAAAALNASVDFDRRLLRDDVRGSQAHARMLAAVGLISTDDAKQIVAGLEQVAGEFERGERHMDPALEDVHMNVENRLIEIIGDPGRRLHTARSRNDQVATDLRLYAISASAAIVVAIDKARVVLCRRAREHAATLLPGYTHLQRAQAITLGHHLLAYAEMLSRDRGRFLDAARRASECPLGSGALAATSLPIDRQKTCDDLGFGAPTRNSLDAVSDRDFAAEFMFCATLVGVHLSKLAEQIVLFTSAEFGFFELSDAFSTGSSLMPQKKNPDVFELTRAKAGTLLGSLTGLLATLKGLPSSYDKDLQEDKAPVFAAADTLLLMLPVLSGALQTITPRPERMRAAIDSFMLATDLADYLVNKGIPFRETHALAGKAVRLALDNGLGLDGLSLQQYKSLHPAFEADVYTVLDPLESVKRRKALGGTAPSAVQSQIQQAKSKLSGE